MLFLKIRLTLFVSILCCFAAVKTQAQLCTGSLGDPVVNIDFGNGYGSNTGYTPTSSYNFAGGQCPNDGFYTITRQSLNCFGNTWHSVTADHTGNGAFLLVNASYAPGDFMVTKVTNLCPNITYEFAAWVLNILNRSGIKPNITFTIETESGTILQQYNTGDIPETFSPQWKQYGFFFTTPVNNPVIVLRMRNNAPGGLGNDIAMDDITFRPCSSVLLSCHFTSAANDTVQVCENAVSTYIISGLVSSGTYTNPLYQWQVSNDSGKVWADIANANTLAYTAAPVTAGAYWYRFTATEAAVAANKGCRIASNYVVVNVHPQPMVNAGGNKVIIAGNPITLNAAITATNYSFTWWPALYLNDAALLQPVALPPADIQYILQAQTFFGCTGSDTAFIKVIKGIFVPNSFTPDNDGKNDTWRIPYLDASLGAAVSVYNRYGQRVYVASGTPVNWDGSFKQQLLPAGNYVFIIQFSNGYPDIKGNVLLIR